MFVVSAALGIVAGSASIERDSHQLFLIPANLPTPYFYHPADFAIASDLIEPVVHPNAKSGEPSTPEDNGGEFISLSPVE